MLSGYMIRQERESTKNLVLQSRNFYGPLEVRDDPVTQDYAERTLLHGTINHGSQLRDPVLRYVTTSYYGKRSGVGRALTALQAKGPIRAGLIGLGSGVLTNYGRKGDYIRVYEINPLIERIAQSLFTFYPHTPADKAILMGDARLTLENQLKEGPQNYDLLAVDAFPYLITGLQYRRPRASSSAASSGPAQATLANLATPWVEPWARCAVPKASITNTSHSAAYCCASSSVFFFSPLLKRTFSSSTSSPACTWTPFR